MSLTVRTVLILLCIVSTACERLRNWDTTIIVYNKSPYKVTLITDGERIRTLSPNATENFGLTVSSTGSYTGYTGPTPNRQTQISVAFYNEATGTMTSPIYCEVRESSKTTILFEAAYQSPGGYQYASCYMSY